MITASVLGRLFMLFYFLLISFGRPGNALKKRDSILFFFCKSPLSLELLRLIPLILVLILKNTESEAAHFRKPPVFPREDADSQTTLRSLLSELFQLEFYAKGPLSLLVPESRESPVVVPQDLKGVGSDAPGSLVGCATCWSAGGLTGERWRRKVSILLTGIFFTRVMLSGPTKT